jgi:hydroxypyruvate reductase
LALAAAERLADWPKAVVLLAGGSDGRDGPTDATGAIVDTTTWHRIEQSGIRAAHALAHHDAYPALQEAGALFRIGHTGTNVMDLVIGLVGPAPAIA